MGNHIVGGEMEMVHLSGFNYQINLIQYFDLAQDVNPGPEPFIFVYTFRKRDNAVLRIDTLSLGQTSLVPYTNILCIIDELRTLKATYSQEVYLDPEIYDDPEGYYLVWERCCRNFSITNIVNPGGTGMTYYLEFPPVVKNGEPFVNSSPQLFPPLSDYACVNQLYYVDFAGTDVDGDSVAYSLVTPSNSSALAPVPIPTPAPHPTAQFRTGITLANTVPGNPSLQINNQGFVTVRPSNVGLYVFSVLAEEFRDKQKIGEVRRDFQLLVVDGCTSEPPPQAKVDVPNRPNFNPDTDFINFSADQEDKCFNLLVSDNSNFDRLKVRAIPVNFDADVSDILSLSEGIVFPGRETLEVEICVGRCPYLQDEPYIIDFIVSDDSCPQPQLDTVRVRFNVEPPPNTPPVFLEVPDPIIQTNENELNTFLIIGEDADMDSLSLILIGDDFDPDDFGFSLETIVNRAGRIEKRLTWDTNCAQYEFGGRSEFNLKLKLEDFDECMFDARVEEEIEFTVILPENTAPTIATSLESSEITQPLSGLLQFTVTANDLDNDEIELYAEGVGFALADVGATFPPMLARGTVEGTFIWDLNCANFSYTGQNSYTFRFIAEDLDQCNEPNEVFTEVTVNLEFAENNAPRFVPIGATTFFVNQNNSLEISATDEDNDQITIRLLRNVLFDNFGFQPVAGRGSATGILEWNPGCDLLGDNFSTRTYTIDFLVADNSCPTSLSDTLSIAFDIEEPAALQRFEPANAFSPNGDGINDFFTMVGLDDEEKNLPPDLCENAFEEIRIFDRNGLEVYRSFQRDFVWDGGGRSNGTYFYVVKYTFNEYKGYITLIK